MKPVRLRKIARGQIGEISRFIESERPGHGALFLDAVESALRQISQLPDSFPAIAERHGVRKAVLRSPFTKFVLYFESSDELSTVIAVLHGARRPGSWRK